MGSCLSKKESSSSTTTTCSAVTVTNKTTPLPDPPSKDEENKKKPAFTTTTTTITAATTTKNPQKEESNNGVMKKEVFVIKQRRSHERRPSEGKITISTPTTSNKEDPSSSSSGEGVNGNGNNVVERSGIVRTSSCTKEEVDAILIQCGRLSRSSSGNNLNNNNSNTRKYSGSKRSYDFDHDAIEKGGDDIDNVGVDANSHHHQRRHSRSSHRRNSSREKDVEGGSSTKRSGSREKRSSSREEDRTRSGGGSGSRRVSRSPGRRSETPSSANAAGGAGVTEKSRPGKMVSVPASNRGGADSGTMAGSGVKRVSVRRSGEIGRTTAASPRSQSPANVRSAGNNENLHQHPHSLSRSNSRKAEHSPYRRNPMAEIDDNSQRPNENTNLKNQKIKDCEPTLNKKSSILQSQQETNNNGSRDVKENIGLSTGAAAGESLKPHGITRTRSARRSRDFDLNSALEPDTILNPTSYASLLLEDIQNFHQQNTTTTTPTAAAAAATAFTLPACVTKACSILDAVADLNLCASSNISNDDRNCFEVSDNRSNNNKNFSKSTTNAVPFNPLGKKRLDGKKKTYVESELVVGNDEEEEDLMEPSLHKYITVRRDVNVVNEEKDMEQQESSGSNSVVAAQHNWASSSSSWEPNSADSTDRWTSRSNTTGGELEEPNSVIPEKVKQQQNISGTPMRRKKETNELQGKVIGGNVRGQMRIPIAAASM
ncbi:uncharacterized protein At1g65710-like isoform X2 [Papaver somniferum]|uniref:uncharacterized protein At1g65710-like isoform X2 n=1 Tax=Papaver somniferum TaxID=3469 RepID=UPI000E6FABCA|nr:uncharacterized protein At1g65710-like isoform X2 [Papaver somniferum]